MRRRAWSRRSASARCSKTSRRWRFRCDSSTARLFSGRFRSAKYLPCSDPPPLSDPGEQDGHSSVLLMRNAQSRRLVLVLYTSYFQSEGVFYGEPLTPDQARGWLSPERALVDVD